MRFVDEFQNALHDRRVVGELTRQVVGPDVDHADKVKGYWFWGLVATFIAVPEVLAAVSDPLEAHIPWPTISNLVGKDLEARGDA